MTEQQPLYIDTPAGLESLSARLAQHDWFALDTEFMREKTYQPQFCLLQVATPEFVACIDPLALPDLAPLLEVLYDPARLKVLHAARQDLEIFYYLRGTLPGPVFDTQIAAAVLGYGDQVGYANLVQALLGVRLDKAHSRADWARRPLEPEQLRYAADDVVYLCRLYPQLHEALAAQQRLDWLREDFTALTDPGQYAAAPEDAWRRVSGVHRLRGQQLAVAQQLAAWREQQARAQNRPRKWLLRDEWLVDLARQMPADLGRLQRLRGMDAGTVQRLGPQLVELIRAAKALPPERWPALEPREILSPEQDALVDLMMALVRLGAARHSVSVATLASRRDLEQIALGRRDVPLLHGWRAALVGAQVLALLEGTLNLSVVDGRPEIRPAGPQTALTAARPG